MAKAKKKTIKALDLIRCSLAGSKLSSGRNIGIRSKAGAKLGSGSCKTARKRK